MNSRALAAHVLYGVLIEKHSLADTLNAHLSQLTEARDKPFVQSLCYGVCRWFYKLDFILSTLLEKPLKLKDNDLKILLLVGLYQLIYMRVSTHAGVTETVNATQFFQKTWAKGLVNAVLRNYLRRSERMDIPQQTNNLEVEFSHPLWLIHELIKNYPKDWQEILNANNEHPPLSLRINVQRHTRDNYCKKLSELGLKAMPIPETESGIILENPMDVKQIPGFVLGDISVQDGAAQLAGQLLELEPHLQILDACAAPGGKTAHILERQPSIQCSAIDRDPDRLERIRENLTRLQLSANLITADAGNIESWWSGNLFDRILLDAPCSATGVIRRHPDIKFLRQENDISMLAKEQLRLLTNLWKVLKKGGILLYCTCSVLPEENSQVIEKFLAYHQDATPDKLLLTVGMEVGYGRQIIPGMYSMDGFYYARLRKGI